MESPDLKFGLLGSLLVCREETILTVPAGKQRALLAALLVNAGRVVPADELIEVLWDSRRRYRPGRACTTTLSGCGKPWGMTVIA